jgi:repressor LexA
MIEAGIFDGDKIICQKTPYADNGDIVVALIEDSATVKRFYKRNGKFILHPENPTLSDIVLNEVEILGKVTGLVRKF